MHPTIQQSKVEKLHNYHQNPSQELCLPLMHSKIPYTVLGLCLLYQQIRLAIQGSKKED
jgi:hypothetical protein